MAECQGLRWKVTTYILLKMVESTSADYLNTHHPRLIVAVIGGGIGGLYTALSLHHHCSSAVEIDVYEQAPEYKEIGAGVGIGVNAAKLLNKIGIGRAVSEIAGKRSKVWITFRKFDDGGLVVTVPSADTEDLGQLSVHRADLLDLLVGIVNQRRAARLHTKKRCAKLTVCLRLTGATVHLFPC
jgi:salicylate hydroxylase